MLLAALMAMALDTPAGPGAADAVAPSTLKVFEMLCVAAEGDFSTAITQADAMGWRQPGPRVLADLPGSLAHMKDGQLRVTPAPGGGAFLVFTGHDVAAGPNGAPGKNRVCGVVGSQVGSPDSAFRKDVAAWAGGSPMISSADRVVFAVQGSAGQRSATEAQKDFDAGKLRGVVALSPPGANILVYLVPTQAN
jgi:hypothetical protein